MRSRIIKICAFLLLTILVGSFPPNTFATTPTISLLTSVVDDGSLLLDSPRSVKIQGNYAYMLSLNDKSITIFDISTPSSPSKVGEIQDIPNLTGKRFLEVSGNYVYVGGTASGLLLSYDVTNKAAPVLADSLTLTNIFYDFEIQNEYLYAFGDTGTTCFTVVNISDPTNLTESTVASNADGKCNGNLAGDVSGNYVYTMSTAFSDEYLTIFDISTPTSPTYVSSLSFTNAGFPDSNWQDAEYYDGYLYTTGWQSDVLLSIDVSDPTTPTLADSYVNGSLMDAGVYLERIGSHIIVAGYFSKTLLAFSIVDPTNLTLTHSLADTTNLNNPYDFTTNGQYIYIPSVTNDIFSIFTFDGIAPTVSLTSLTPDPTTDTTPIFSGTSTDVGNTVASVAYQVDSTSGSWSSCTADDGVFDEIADSFTCSLSSLADGAHTLYVRSTDSLDNVSSSSSDAFTVDTASPTYLSISVGSVTHTSGTVTYSTSEATSTQLQYGTTTSYGVTTTEADTTTRTTSHSVSLSGLELCTTYHFRLLGSDAAGNVGQSDDSSFTTGGCSDPAESSPAALQIPQGSSQDAGGVFAPVFDSYTGNQEVSVIVEPRTLPSDAYISSMITETESFNGILSNPLAQDMQTSSQTGTGNTVQAGGVGGVLGIRQACGIAWQVGEIQQIWYKTYPAASDKPAAKIIPELQKKPSIIALTYDASDLVPAGQPRSRFSQNTLKLAHSIDGATWKTLPTSVVDAGSKTVAALDKVGGYYMIVSGCQQSASSPVLGVMRTRTVPEVTEDSMMPIDNDKPTVTVSPVKPVKEVQREAPSDTKPSFMSRVRTFIMKLRGVDN